MKFTADNDVKSLASTTLATLKAIADDAEKALAELDRDEESKPEVIEKKRQAIFDEARARYSKARAELGAKADSITREIRLLSERVTAPKPDPVTMSMLNLLSVSPLVTQMQLNIAAEQATDDFARDMILQLATRHGLQMPHFEPKEKHLKKADLEEIADDLTSLFKFVFDVHSEFVPERAAGGTQPNTPEREISLMRGKRTNAEYSLQRLANGAAFRFSDPVMQQEFDTAAAVTEL